MRGVEVDFGDVLVAEEDVEDAVEARGTKGDGVFVEGGSDFEAAAAEPDIAAELDFTDEITGLVKEGWESLGERSRRGAVAGGGHVELECIMRPLEVVEVAPLIEGALSLGEIREGATSKQLITESAMESFIFALGLRMVRPGVRDVDAETDEPGGQWGEVMIAVATPGRTVIHGHALGQAIETEDRGQPLLHGLRALIGASLKAQSEAGVIVQDSERVAAGLIGGEVAFEVHLPELIGSRVFEPLEDSMLERLLGVHPSVSQEDLVNRAGRRQTENTEVEQAPAQLASSPGRVLVSQP